MFNSTANESLDMDDSFLHQRKSFTEAIENISMPSDFLNVSTFVEPSFPIDLNQSKLSEISDINHMLDYTDYVLKEEYEERKIEKFINKSLEDEINNYKNLLNEVNRARIQRNKMKFILDTITNMFENATELPHHLKEKCTSRLQFCNLMKYINYNDELLKSIGIDDTERSLVLTDKEKRLILSVFKKKVEAKCAELKTENDIIREFVGNRPKSVTLPGTTLTQGKAKILSLVNEIVEAITLCSDELKKISESVRDLHDLRVSKFWKLHKEEVDCLASRTQLLGLKMKNLNYMIENAIIQQSDKLSQAVDKLHTDLKNALDDAEYSLQKKKAIKESYDCLENTRFREILREFLDLRESYTHKTWALKQLQNPKESSRSMKL